MDFSGASRFSSVSESDMSDRLSLAATTDTGIGLLRAMEKAVCFVEAAARAQEPDGPVFVAFPRLTEPSSLVDVPPSPPRCPPRGEGESAGSVGLNRALRPRSRYYAFPPS